MTVVAVLRDELRELMKQITLHIGVGVLIHEHCRGRVRNVYHAYTFTHLRPRDRGAYTGCHIDGHLAFIGAHRELLVVGAHGATILPPCGRGSTLVPPRARACAPPLTLTPRRSMPTCCLRMCSASGRRPSTPIPSASSPQPKTVGSRSSSNDGAAASRWRICAASRSSMGCASGWIRACSSRARRPRSSWRRRASASRGAR